MASKANDGDVRAQFDWQPTKITAADYAGGEADGSTVTAGSNPQELAYAEVSDDNGVDSQLATYDMVRLGQPLGSNDRSAQGKLFVDLQGDQDGDGTVEQVDGRTQFRWIVRPRNGDERRALTDWFVHADANQSDPEKRIAIPPVTNENGEPVYVQEGRVLALEVRNPATDVTVSLSDSQIRAPAMVGY